MKKIKKLIKIKNIPGVLDSLFVVIFFTILAVMVFFFLRKPEYVLVTLRVSQSDGLKEEWYQRTPEWYLENLSVSLEDKDVMGRTNLKLEKVHYYPTLDTVQTVFITLKVRAAYSKSSKQYTYNGVPLLIGSFQSFKFGEILISGVIHDVNQSLSSREMKEYIVTGMLENQKNEEVKYPANTSIEGVKKRISERLQAGMKVYDSDKNIIAEIVSVHKTPAHRQFISGSNLVNVIDPERENVELTVKLFAKEINRKPLYREEIPIFINSVIDLDFDQFEIALTITDISTL